jgi:hypothetical protein
MGGWWWCNDAHNGQPVFNHGHMLAVDVAVGAHVERATRWAWWARPAWPLARTCTMCAWAKTFTRPRATPSCG